MLIFVLVFLLYIFFCRNVSTIEEWTVTSALNLVTGMCKKDDVFVGTLDFANNTWIYFCILDVSISTSQASEAAVSNNKFLEKNVSAAVSEGTRFPTRYSKLSPDKNSVF